MRGYSTRFTGFFISCLMLAGCSSGQAPVGTITPPLQRVAEGNGAPEPVCPRVTGEPTCLALIESKGGISPTVGGLEPSDIQTRYNLPSSTKGSGQIVAIVDPYDNPNVASDLAAYRAEFGLGTANFTKYNQAGQTSNFPAGSTSWGFDKDVETEMVSAACPNCTIYLIEANSSNGSDLQAAEVEAVKLGAHIVANAWICYGSVTCVSSSDFDTPGVVYLAAPAATATVKPAPRRRSPASSPSAAPFSRRFRVPIIERSFGTKAAPAAPWASASLRGSTIRTAHLARWPTCRPSPRTSRSTTRMATTDGRIAYGTPLSVAVNAGVFGLAGNASSQNAAEHFWTMSKKKRNKELHYISMGNDGSCRGEYLCTAGTKQFGRYSGPAGWGTPNGIKAY